MTSRNSHHRIVLTATAATALAVVASGCGAIVERVTEEAVEQAVESEGGGDVEVDFDADSGTFSIEGQDGDATFSIDEDGLQIEGTDDQGNDFSLEANEDGVNAEGGNGETVVIDEDGSFTATDADGEVTTGEIDPDGGEFVIEGEDGGAVFSTGMDIPDGWPSDVPEPEGLTNIGSSFQSDGDSVFIIVAGESSDSVEDAASAYISAIEDAGFEQQSIFQDNSSQSATFTRGDETMSVSASDTGGSTQFSVTYSR